MTISGSIHLSKNGPVLFLFWLSTIPLYACATSFVHSSVDGHLGCSFVLDIGSGAAVSIGARVSLGLWFSGVCPAVLSPL